LNDPGFNLLAEHFCCENIDAVVGFTSGGAMHNLEM